MTKYSDELKLRIVKEYLLGHLSYDSIASKYSIRSSAHVRRWVHSYNAFGEKGLHRKKTKKVYTVQFKCDVLHFMKNTGASYQETAIRFHMNNATLIANWARRFKQLGIEGLKDRVKGRPSMSKKSSKPSARRQKEMTPEEQLKREIELLRLENAYLKKLQAFQENPNAFLAKHKQ